MGREAEGDANTKKGLESELEKLQALTDAAQPRGEKKKETDRQTDRQTEEREKRKRRETK